MNFTLNSLTFCHSLLDEKHSNMKNVCINKRITFIVYLFNYYFYRPPEYSIKIKIVGWYKWEPRFRLNVYVNTFLSVIRFLLQLGLFGGNSREMFVSSVSPNFNWLKAVVNDAQLPRYLVILFFNRQIGQ